MFSSNHINVTVQNHWCKRSLAQPLAAYPYWSACYTGTDAAHVYKGELVPSVNATVLLTGYEPGVVHSTLHSSSSMSHNLASSGDVVVVRVLRNLCFYRIFRQECDELRGAERIGVS